MNKITSLDDFLQLKNSIPFEKKHLIFNYYFESFKDYKAFDFNKFLTYKFDSQKINEIKVYSLCLHIENLYKSQPELVAFNFVQKNGSYEKNNNKLCVDNLDIATCDKNGSINYNWDDMKYHLSSLLKFIDESIINLFSDRFILSDREERFESYKKITNGLYANKEFLEFIKYKKTPENMIEGHNFFYTQIFSKNYPAFPSKAIDYNFKYSELIDYDLERKIQRFDSSFKLLHLSGYISLLHEFFTSLNVDEYLSISMHHDDKYLVIDYNVKDEQGNIIQSEKYDYYKNCLKMIKNAYLSDFGDESFVLIIRKDYLSSFDEKNKCNLSMFDVYDANDDFLLGEVTKIYSNQLKNLYFDYKSGDINNLIYFSAGLLKTAYLKMDNNIFDNDGDTITMHMIDLYKMLIQKDIILNNVIIEDNDNTKKLKRL